MQTLNDEVIKIIGVGGAGCKIIDLLLECPVEDIEYYAVDTNFAALKNCSCGNKIRIGTANDDCTAEVTAEMSDIVKDSDMVILISGLGGVAGSKITPVIAQFAKEENVFMPIVAITPIDSEKKEERDRIATALKKLKNIGSSVFTVQNHKAKRLVSDVATEEEIYSIGDNAILDLIEGIIYPICYYSVCNLDCKSIFEVLSCGGLAYFGVGEGNGDNKVLDAVKQAVFNNLSYGTIEGQKHVIVSVTENSNAVLADMHYAVDLIRQVVDPKALIVMAARNEPIERDKFKVVLIAG